MVKIHTCSFTALFFFFILKDLETIRKLFESYFSFEHQKSLLRSVKSTEFLKVLDLCLKSTPLSPFSLMS